MQTFLPYPDFHESAACLDNKRLGKQRVEALQLVEALVKGTRHHYHPAAKMWKGYLPALITYGMVCCQVWRDRGFKDSVWTSLYMYQAKAECEMPPWLGSPKFHDSHKSNLLLKDIGFYRKFNWEVELGLPYFWPTPDYDWRKHEKDNLQGRLDGSHYSR